MIRVTVELLSAVTGNTTVLGRAYISNVTGATEHLLNEGRLGNYHVTLSGKGGEVDPQTGRFKKVYREGRVTSYPRLSLVFWHLIARALTAACAAPVPEGARRKRKGVQSAPSTQEGTNDSPQADRAV